MRLPLTLRLRRSRALVAALVLAHLFVALGLLATDIAVIAKLSVVLALGLFLPVALRRTQVDGLTLGSDGKLKAVDHDGDTRECDVDPSTTVFTWLIVLRLRTSAGSESLVLPVDALGVEGHRQLRLWLRWKATLAVA